MSADRSFDWNITVVPSDGDELSREGTSGSLASLRTDVRDAVSDIAEDIEIAEQEAEEGEA